MGLKWKRCVVVYAYAQASSPPRLKFRIGED
jgi:hypothetical protein